MVRRINIIHFNKPPDILRAYSCDEGLIPDSVDIPAAR
jgi:hypothetical protein